MTSSARPTDTIASQTAGNSATPRSPQLYQASLSNALAAAHIADQLRGQNILVLDLTGITSIVDFFIIATGTSSRQMHAIR
jgi:ribosome-associated protein